MEVSVERERCQGAGMCALTAPEVFDQDEHDGLVVLLETRPPYASHAAVREAATLCPAGAIAIAGADGDGDGDTSQA
ncbi:ferredoxin [Streptomyces sp. Je 1-79]|uniref:ferredoxin n=1 Tax=Streptomyces sp. Je 1-79 TaxID=2943847 RepID=UPI0021A46F58|nr:ferredoxin [Streptomyces sp. Je 1-79]MCT4352013.1 ferredoxin [Streptomyces sp. Je 1-79]